MNTSQFVWDVPCCSTDIPASQKPSQSLATQDGWSPREVLQIPKNCTSFKYANPPHPPVSTYIHVRPRLRFFPVEYMLALLHPGNQEISCFCFSKKKLRPL